MKKTLLAVIVASVMAVALFGCSSGGSTSSSSSSSAAENNNVAEVADSAEPQDLIISDSGYVLKNGYVMYAVEIENPNTNWGAQYANISITATSKSGDIRFSDDWTVGPITPGTKTYWATQAGDGDTKKDDTVEFDVSVSDYNWSEGEATIPADLYTFDNVKVAKGEYNMTAKGKITMSENDIDGAARPMLVCILKDEKGKIVTGFNGYMSSDLKPGKTTAFDIDGYFSDVKYKKAEMYANPWM